MITDGCKVSYIGEIGPSEIAYDEQGVVLSVAGKDSAHVKWHSGKVTLTEMADLSPIRNSSKVESELDDSLDVSGLSQFTAQSIFNENGPEGLLEALEESGALGAYDDAVEAAMESLLGTIARSGWLKKLDETDRSDMALLVAQTLFKRV